MKKNPISVIALICGICALAVSIWAGSAVGQLQSQVEDLRLENETLIWQLQAMQAESAVAETPMGVGECSLLIDDWSCENGALTIKNAYLQVLDAAAEPDVALSLRRSGNLLHRVGIETVPAEGIGSYEATVRNVTFDSSLIPELTEGDCLELWLEVTLGSTESACVAEWYLEKGELQLIAG